MAKIANVCTLLTVVALSIGDPRWSLASDAETTEKIKTVLAACASDTLRKNMRHRYHGEKIKVPEDHYEQVVEATMCIMRSSPIVTRSDKKIEFDLQSRRSRMQGKALMGEAIGPDKIEMDSEENSYTINGMVHILDGFRGYCSWTYEFVTKALDKATGTLDCVDDKDRSPKAVSREDKQGWIEDSFGSSLEMVLDSLIRRHEYFVKKS